LGGAALEATNVVGLPLFDTNGMVGMDYPDYWVYGTWTIPIPIGGGRGGGSSGGSGPYTGWADAVNGTNQINFGAEADAVTNSTLPTVAITSQFLKKGISVVDGSPTIFVTGTATLNSKVLNNYISEVQFSLDGVNWTNVDTMNAGAGITNWSSYVTLNHDGLGGGTTQIANTLHVRAIDATDDTATTTKSYNYQHSQAATIDVNGNGTVAYGKVAFFVGTGQTTTPLLIGKTYSLTITQTNDNSYYASNLVYSYADPSGALDTVSDPTVALSIAAAAKKAYGTTFSFEMKSNADVAVTFVPSRFTGAKGTYNGLFYEDTISLASAGYFTITVNADALRTYSGSLTFTRGNAVPFSGHFALDGTSTTTIALATNLAFDLKLSDANTTNDTIWGTMTSQIGVDGVGLNSTMIADKQIVTAATAYSGMYTMALPGTVTGTNEGAATATLTVSATKGTATLANMTFGSGADAQSVPVVSSNGVFPVFIKANGWGAAKGVVGTNNGLVIGWLQIDNTPGGAGVFGADELGGTLTWVHDAADNNANVINANSSSWDTLIHTFTQTGDIIGSPFSFTTGQPLMTFAGGDSNGGTQGTASFSLNGNVESGVPVIATNGWVEATPFWTTNHLTVKGKAVTTYTTFPTEYSLVIAPLAKKAAPDGHLTGTFTNGSYGTFTIPWNGVIIQTHNEILGGYVINGANGNVLMQ
jgi:hypothetical protein